MARIDGRPQSRRFVLATAFVLAGAAIARPAIAADRIRLVAQRTGSLAWELDVIRAYGLDKKANLDIETLELASTEAGKVALRGGSADVIVSDWTWVARERALGDGLVYYPYLSTLGAVMAPANSPIKDVADLKGKKLGVAGGPIDKSWLLLQALGLRAGIDLKKEATIVYGAPPLLSEKALQGETDATLTFWNFCADLEGKGQKRAIRMDEVLRSLGASGPVAMLGYVFDGGWAARNRATLDRFLAASREAKEILAGSDAEWQRLGSRIGVNDAATLALYRQRYSEGIPRRHIDDEEADARALYRILADIGGPELVGPGRELDAGSFYRPAAGE
ncbi:MAG TPA: ABC transporter substrate-binding protein [Xanthobacteraceae bacterium]|jgi:NitT/TauT family transport system substrate-binding protein|nr:ABC transporter substrate-binding protein [Xanthobacteraceae bacterium]